jgi:hypothetical protein
MKLFGREFDGYAKWLVILVAVLLVASGLCGIQLALFNSLEGSLSGLFIITGLLELAAIVISIVGIVVVLIAKPAKDRTQRLFGNSSEDDDKDAL